MLKNIAIVGNTSDFGNELDLAGSEGLGSGLSQELPACPPSPFLLHYLSAALGLDGCGGTVYFRSFITLPTSHISSSMLSRTSKVFSQGVPHVADKKDLSAPLATEPQAPSR